jgi:hypothetical protein
VGSLTVAVQLVARLRLEDLEAGDVFGRGAVDLDEQLIAVGDADGWSAVSTVTVRRISCREPTATGRRIVPHATTIAQIRSGDGSVTRHLKRSPTRAPAACLLMV